MRLFMINLTILTFASALFAGETQFTVPIGDSPTIGPASAPVTIIEFLDFQ